MHNVVRNFGKLTHFNYDKQGKDWKVSGGKEQSPISLHKHKAVSSKAPRLSFLNYKKTLSGPITLKNNGHTVTMAIPSVDDDTQPAVCGCKLECIYKAVQLHFHWGSMENKGSEHSIDCKRYDGELHILHQNCTYPSKTEALCSPDGFVVLAIMLRSVSCPKKTPRVLYQVCNEVNFIREFKKSSTFEGDFTLSDILTGLNQSEFFTYKGSLTTPPCSEAVNWFVFPKPIDVSDKVLKNFWLLKDHRGKPLVNNYRGLQRLNNRKVYYRKKTTA